jgi:hypothetical protein
MLLPGTPTWGALPLLCGALPPVTKAGEPAEVVGKPLGGPPGPQVDTPIFMPPVLLSTPVGCEAAWPVLPEMAGWPGMAGRPTCARLNGRGPVTKGGAMGLLKEYVGMLGATTWVPCGKETTTGT